MRKPVALVAALVAIVLATAAPAVGARATPCWSKVIRDWSEHDGAIQGRYSPHCLRQAIKHTREDLRDYTSIIDDISALLYESSGPQGGDGPGVGSTGEGSTPNAGSAPSASPSVEEQARRLRQAVPDAGTPQSIPASSGSVPLPLILLGAALAATALAVGSTPLIRRFRGRLPRLRPTPQADRG